MRVMPKLQMRAMGTIFIVETWNFQTLFPIPERFLNDINKKNEETLITFQYTSLQCYLRCPYYNGWVNAIRAPIEFCSVLVGNISGVLDPNYKK